MISLQNNQVLRQLHVNNFIVTTGSFTRSGNVFTCTNNGTAYIPFKFAYGTWEFDVYKSSTDNTIRIYFISGNNIALTGSLTSYYIFLSNLETIGLVRFSQSTEAVTLFTTSNNYLSNTTVYRIRITRSKENVFTVYIKGGTFTDWTLVSVSGGNGTNPVTDTTYTTSNYSVIDMDTDDKIGNITWKPYI